MTAYRPSTNISMFQGATIKRDESTGALVVARVLRGGAADRSGKMHFKCINIITSFTIGLHFISIVTLDVLLTFQLHVN